MPESLSHRRVGAMALGFTVLSLVIGITHNLFRVNSPYWAEALTLGLLCGGIGSGVGLYCSVRLRGEWLSVIAACLSPAVVGVWAWNLWQHALGIR